MRKRKSGSSPVFRSKSSGSRRRTSPSPPPAVVKLSLSSSSSEENLLEEETEILDCTTTMKESKTECCAHSKDQSSTTAGASETKGSIKMKNNLSEYELCDYREAPAYIVQPYILSGYRANFSVKLCLYSLFRIHNESGNVLTHLFAALYYLWLLFKMYFIGDELDEAYHMHGLHYSLAAFYIACIYCFTASAMFHLFNSHSRDMCCNLLRADFSGIVVLTTASYIPPLYAGFACFPRIRWFYLITVCSIGLIAAVVLLSPKLQRPQYRSIRISLFVAMGIFGFVPIFHGVYVMGWDITLEVIKGLFQYYGLLMLAFVIYFSRLPERLYPGSCDYWVQSHQIWHALIFLGTLKHLENCLFTFDMVTTVDCSIFGGQLL